MTLLVFVCVYICVCEDGVPTTCALSLSSPESLAGQISLRFQELHRLLGSLKMELSCVELQLPG